MEIIFISSKVVYYYEGSMFTKMILLINKYLKMRHTIHFQL